MDNKIRFSFLARPDDLNALAQLASSCDRSNAAMLRKLIRDASTQQKTSLIARTLAAHAMNEVDIQLPEKETKPSQELKYAKFTFTD